MQRFSVIGWVIVCVLGIAAYACGGGEQPQKNAEVPEPGVPGGFEAGQGADDAIGTGDDATQQGQASDSSDEPPALPPIDWDYDVYLAYLESIEIPESVTENEPFDIILHLSAQLKPELLNGLSADSLWGQPVIRKPSPSADYSYVRFQLWLKASNSTEPAVSELIVEVPGLPLDTSRILISSAASPEWGGVSHEHPAFGIYPPESPGAFIVLEIAMQNHYEITVLPAETE